MTYSSGKSKGYTLRLEVNETSYSIENNNSLVSWALYLDSDTYYFQTNRNVATVNVDGNVYNNTSLSIYMSGPKTVLIASGSKTISHNDEGSKTINVSATFTPSSTASYMPPSLSLSGTFKLTDIPRASTISCSSPYIGDNAIISIVKKSSSFTNTVTYKIGSITGTVASKTYDTVLQLDTGMLKEDIYALIPNSRSITGTVTCTTYSGNDQVGNPVTASFNIYAKEDECKPIIEGFIEDTNLTAKALTNGKKLIRFISKPNIKVSATPQYSSTISSYSINVDGQVFTEKEHTFESINSGVITISSTDSRGYTSSQILTQDMIDYIELHLSKCELSRTEGTSSEVMLNLEGVWFNGKFNDSAQNTLNLSYQYRESGQTDWIDGKSLTPKIVGDSFSVDNILLGSNFDYQKEYQFKIIAKDLFMEVGSTNKDIITVSKGQEAVAIGEDGGWLYGEWYLNDNKILEFELENELINSGYGNFKQNSKYVYPYPYYPVGAIVLFGNNTNPNDIYIGKWEQLKDVFILACGDKYKCGDTGGEEKVTLTIDTMPSHQHKAEEDKTHGEGAVYGKSSQGADTECWGTSRGSYKYLKEINTSSVGGNQPHNNMPPYVAKYYWERVA